MLKFASILGQARIYLCREGMGEISLKSKKSCENGEKLVSHSKKSHSFMENLISPFVYLQITLRIIHPIMPYQSFPPTLNYTSDHTPCYALSALPHSPKKFIYHPKITLRIRPCPLKNPSPPRSAVLLGRSVSFFLLHFNHSALRLRPAALINLSIFQMTIPNRFLNS